MEKKIKSSKQELTKKKFFYMIFSKTRFVDGYLTVFVSLTLTAMISLCLMLIEGVRYKTILLETECIVDTGLNSILAEYNRELLEQYNLFFIDCSYGTSNCSYINTQEHLFDYLDKNVSYQDVTLMDFLYGDLLAIEFDMVTLDKISLATDNNASVFRKRAVEALEYDLGISYFQQFTNWINTIDENEFWERNIENERAQYKNSIKELLLDREGNEVTANNEVKEKEDQGATFDAGETVEKKETINKKETTDARDIQAIEWIFSDMEYVQEESQVDNGLGILPWIVEDTSGISKKRVDINQYISKRTDEINRGNFNADSEETLYEKFLFLEYIMKYAGNYIHNKENSFMKYQTEYILIGKESDLGNLKGVVNRLLLFREAVNFAYLCTDKEKCTEAELVATAISTILFVPEAKSIFQTAILMAWSYIESIYDMKCLLNGGNVPLVKNKTTWVCNLEEVIFPNQKKTTNNHSGLKYEDYLRIMLCLADDKKTTLRMMDIVEMDIRNTAGNSHFRIDGCIDKVEARIRVNSDFGYHFFIIRNKSY